MTLRRYRWPALLLLVLHLQACSTWRPTAQPLSEVVRAEPGSIRVTTRDGVQRTLEEPRLVGDSLTTAAVLFHCPRDRPGPCPVTQVNGQSTTPTPVADIGSVELRKFSIGRTVGAVALTGVAAIALLFAAACAGSDGWFCE